MSAQTYKIISFKNFKENTIEIKEKNSVIGSIDEISNKLLKDAGYCEDIKSNEICKLFGDLDFNEEKPIEIINEFSEILLIFLNNFYNLKLSKNDFKYTVNDGKIKEGKKVSSYHWVVPKIAMIKREQKDLLELIFKENKLNEGVDIRPYGNLIFRLPNQSKEGKKGTEHKIKNGDLKDFVLMYIEGAEIKEFKKNIKIKEEKNKHIEYVKKEEKNDDIEDKIKLIKKCLNSFSILRFENYDYWFKLGCAIYNELKDKGLSIFHDASKRASNYDFEAVEKLWIQISIRNIYEIGMGTLVMWAREDNPEFTMNNEEDHYKVKSSINFNKLDNVYYEALYEKSDRNVSTLINYLYPSYFVSSGKNLYFFNHYGIYKNDKDGFYLNKIFESLIKHLKNIEFNINKFKEFEITENISDEEKISIKKKKEERLSKIKDLKHYLGTIKHIKDVKSMLLSTCLIQKLDEKLDETNKDLIGFENGVYDLNSKKLRKGKPEEYVSMTTGYDYTEESEERKKRVVDIISSIWDTENKAKYFIHKLAYILTGNKEERQEINIHTGLGGNGKSLIFDLLRDTLGEYFGLMNVEYFTTYEKDANRANPELVGTKGKRIVLVSEPAENAKLQVDKLKKVSGNEAITARQLRTEPISFKPQFHLHILTNDIPQLSKVDGGIQRRLKIIEYPFIFKNKDEYNFQQQNLKIADPNLSNELKELKMAFFHVLINYFKRDYVEIQEVKEATKEYIEDNNKIHKWFFENYKITYDNLSAPIPLSQLIEEFTNQENEKVTPQYMNKRLQQLGVKKPSKITSGYNKGNMGVFGIKRIDHNEDCETERESYDEIFSD